MNYSKLLLLAVVLLIATSRCTDAKKKKKSKSMATSDSSSSQDYECKLKEKTRRKIESKLVDSGVCFDDCLHRCVAKVRGKEANKCGCYCSNVHGPCSTDQTVSMKVPTTPDGNVDDFLDRICDSAEKKSKCTLGNLQFTIKPGTRSRLCRDRSNIDLGSDKCQENCEDILFGNRDATPRKHHRRHRSRSPRAERSATRRRKDFCKCICHQKEIPMTTLPATTTETTTEPPIIIDATEATPAATTDITQTTPEQTMVTEQGTTEQATSAQPTTTMVTERRTTTTVQPTVMVSTTRESTTEAATSMPATTVQRTTTTTEAMTTEATTTEATTTEATTTEATTTEATTSDAEMLGAFGSV